MIETSVSGDRIWIVLEGMLQVTRTAVKFSSAQQQLVERVVRRKGGMTHDETCASNNSDHAPTLEISCARHTLRDVA
jgi:hypothetical protein